MPGHLRGRSGRRWARVHAACAAVTGEPGGRRRSRDGNLHTPKLFTKSAKVAYIRVMPIDPNSEILACPHRDTGCARENGTALKCDMCKRVYPIKDDIPVMLIDEATVEP